MEQLLRGPRREGSEGARCQGAQDEEDETEGREKSKERESSSWDPIPIVTS